MPARQHRAVGAPLGVLDQAASFLCREGHALLLDCGTLAHRLVLELADAPASCCSRATRACATTTRSRRRSSTRARSARASSAAASAGRSLRSSTPRARRQSPGCSAGSSPAPLTARGSGARRAAARVVLESDRRQTSVGLTSDDTAPRGEEDAAEAPRRDAGDVALPSRRRDGPDLTAAVSLQRPEGDRLRALPERQPAELLQLLAALDHGGEVVRPQVTGLGREAAVAVGK